MAQWDEKALLNAYQKRAQLYASMSGSGAEVEEQRAWLMAYYAIPGHCAQWIEDWCITYDPRNEDPIPKRLPFIPFERQKAIVAFLLSCMQDQQDGLLEKCRDFGATWICCAVSVWCWLFIKDSAIGWGSRKEMLVDRLGDPDSIMEKMRMIIRELPPWMRPGGYDESKHATFMKIINPQNGATITGEAGDNIGRGGRKKIYFKDESAHYERPEKIEAAVGDNTRCAIDISSVNGAANVFYRRRHAGVVWEPGKEIPKGKVRVLLLDWRDHPLKDQEWYDMRRARYADEGLLHLFAQEVDRDYSAALDRVMIPAEWARACIDAHKKIPAMLELRGRSAALDVADEGGDKNAFVARDGVVMGFCEDWGAGDTGVTAARAWRLMQQYNIDVLDYDSVGVGAGVKAEFNRLIEAKTIPASVTLRRWNGGLPPLNPTRRLIPLDPKSVLIEDFFANLKAQAWWNVRVRCEKTFKMLYQGHSYPADELISFSSDMPKVQELIMQLSQAQIAKNRHLTVNKLMVDKAPPGTRSPNLADATVMLYTPLRSTSILDVVQ